MQGLYAISVALVIVLQSVFVAAQDTPTEAQPASQTETLPPVVISATRGGPRSAEELPVSVTVITREEIEASPSLSVDEILRNVPGIQLQLTNSNTILPIIPSISMRGLGLGDNGTRTLVLVDGLPANGAFFGNVFWNRVPKQNIERIEIVRGSGSAEFGTYALGGVVNIVTRRLPDRPQVEADAGYGTQETFQGNFYGGTPLTEALRLSLNANYYDSDGYFEVAPEFRGPIDSKTRADTLSIQGKAEYAPMKHVILYLRGNYYTQDISCAMASGTGAASGWCRSHGAVPAGTNRPCPCQSGAGRARTADRPPAGARACDAVVHRADRPRVERRASAECPG